MNLKQIGLTLIITAGLSWGLTSCTSQAKKDAEAKAKIEALLPGVTADVKDGVASLSGELTDEHAKEAATETAQGVAGVSSVINNTTVIPPLPAVTINPDEELTRAAQAAVEVYPGVSVNVADGVISLSGTISKADWMKLKPALDALHPKKVENNLTVK